MRCPKCYYLSFEPEPRCRNCGYDLSLADGDLAFDLAPAEDAVTVPSEPERDHTAPADPLTLDLAEPAAVPESEEAAFDLPILPQTSPHPFASKMPAVQTAELPLFVQQVEDVDLDAPLVKVPSSPRPPLAVRRSTPDPSKLRAKYARPLSEPAGDLPLDLLDGSQSGDRMDAAFGSAAEAPAPIARADSIGTASRANEDLSGLPEAWQRPVGVARRMGAAAIDGILLFGLDVVVVWLTLYSCGLGILGLTIVPLAPLVGFVAILNWGYLILFTVACGQTIGKMMFHLRVVGTSAEAIINDRITAGQAILRSLATMLSIVPLGLGYWLAMGSGRRTLHDRLAHTRVVGV